MSIVPIRSAWAGTLTPRERFNRQMHHQPFDRSFNMEFGYWQENYEQWPVFKDRGITKEWQANQLFNFDPIGTVWGNIWLSPGFKEAVVSETPTTRILMNYEGLLAEVPKDAHGTIPHYIKASIVTPEDWKRCKAERFRRDDPARRIKLDELQRQHPADRTYPLGIACGSMIGKIRDLLTFEGLCYAIYDYPDMVEDMIETCCVMVEDLLDQVLPHFKFDYASGWEDICFKNGPIISVDYFNQVIVPRYKRISRKLRAHSVDLWYTDCDGDVRPLVPGFLEGGINCLFPFEVMAGGHPGDLLRDFAPDLRLMGGVDKLQLIAGPDAIKRYLESLVPWVEKGGFIPFCDHRCPPDVSPENYFYYLDLKERLFGQPRG